MTNTPPATTFPTIFYSWQSDLPANVCRHFIEDAIKRAAKKLCKECELVMDPRIDRDTKDEPGSPDIVKIIERKIEHAQAFVGDLSLVAKNLDGKDKWLPNASVATETGFAIASLGERRVVLPFNEAFGDPNDLPFDLRNRRVLRYTLAPKTADESEEAWQERRAPVRDVLVSDLVDALRAIFEKSADTPPPTMLARHAELVARQQELEKQVARRTLSDEQRTVLKRHLLPGAGRAGILITSPPTDAEADGYASDFANVCSDSGWAVNKVRLLLTPVAGIAIAVGDRANLPGEARILVAALRELGLEHVVITHAEVKNQTGFRLDEVPTVTCLLVGQKLR